MTLMEFIDSRDDLSVHLIYYAGQWEIDIKHIDKSIVFKKNGKQIIIPREKNINDLLKNASELLSGSSFSRRSFYEKIENKKDTNVIHSLPIFGEK